MPPLSVRRIVARVGGLGSIALLAYIAYAHVAEWRTTREYLEDPIAVRFESTKAIEELGLHHEGAIEATASGGVLHVTGVTTKLGPPAHLEFLGPPLRLREAEVHLRFRVPEQSHVDVGVAFVRTDGVEASVGFEVSNDRERPSYRFVGDERADLPRAGDEFGNQRFVPFERPNQYHEITLRVSPDLHAVLGSVDGGAASSHLAGWDDGVLVRPSFFVSARSSEELFEVDIAQMDYQPLYRNTRRRDLDERFDGQVLDPAFWRVLFADGWLSDGSVKLMPHKGLQLTGHALRKTREADVVGLIAPSQELGSFRATMHFEAIRLRHARVYFGISNLLFGLPDWRTFEIGLTGGDVQYEPFAAGHWEGDQQFVVTSFTSAPVDSTNGELGIAYDAHTRMAIGTLNGRVLTKQRLDLQPPEEARLQLGVRVIDDEGDFNIIVGDVHYEALPWTAGEVREVARREPDDARERTFLDDFGGPAPLQNYRVLQGSARLSHEREGLILGLGTATEAHDQELVRGFFDAPVCVTARIAVPAAGAAGTDDSAGVMALDRDGDARYLAALWYGPAFLPSLHLTRTTKSGGEALATAEVPIERGRQYFVKMLVDRRNVYARYWLDDSKVKEPSTWLLTAPVSEGWTATGGVGIAAHVGEVRITSLEAR